MSDILNRVLPILILLVVGAVMRRTRFVSDSAIADLRKIVVNIALPAVLFIAFLETEVVANDLVIVIATFALPVGLYLVGRALQPRFGNGHEYFPLLMTGFEAGMLGISLFGAAYGLDRVGQFAIVDLGHELFIWFVYLALLLAKRDGTQNSKSLVTAFVKSPAIVAIVGGIFANLAGLETSLYDWPIAGGLMATLGFVAALTVPLILLIVGYGIHLDTAGIRGAVRPVLVRLAVVLPLAIVLPLVLMGNILDNNREAQAALFTLLILPPPFIVPLYMKPGVDDEHRYVNNALSLYAVVSVAIFVGYVALNPL